MAIDDVDMHLWGIEAHLRAHALGAFGILMRLRVLWATIAMGMVEFLAENLAENLAVGGFACKLRENGCMHLWYYG